MQGSILALPGARTSVGVYLAGTRHHTQQAGALTKAEMDADPRQAARLAIQRHDRRNNQLGRVGVRLQHEARASDVLLVSGYVEPKTLHRSERGRFRGFTRYHVGGSAIYEADLPVAEKLETRFKAGVDEAFQDGTVLFYNLGPNGTRGTNLAANKREAIHNSAPSASSS